MFEIEFFFDDVFDFEPSYDDVMRDLYLTAKEERDTFDEMEEEGK